MCLAQLACMTTILFIMLILITSSSQSKACVAILQISGPYLIHHCQKPSTGIEILTLNDASLSRIYFAPNPNRVLLVPAAHERVTPVSRSLFTR